ncbi:sensor of ECF-type sigma factor [Aequorivita sp. H23M31]|uniref:Sensor of ECF-type sigma factor n=1 Tax=Aequorivita ciconiae TaxID=2494375 RepID=A0A410G728_9FLAO|nr:sensor of ECF-type sigma factor [Aequorivita sp. H23M31]QAA83040.1 sensor of ECF-type sigma factor [Aequorivita sp. H23M31]
MRHIIILFLLVTAGAYSQGGKYEKIKALKTAFITEQLSLTPTEAEKFWPVYNKFEFQAYELRNNKHKEIYEHMEEGLDNLTEEDANKIMDNYLSTETSILKLKEQRINALRKIISAKKIIKLHETEEKFKRELLNRYRQGKGKDKP